MSLLIQCINIKKQFGEFSVLDGINLNITIGDKIGLVGINGAGKTTLANIICGLNSADAGKIVYHKKEIIIGHLKQAADYNEASFMEFISVSKNKQVDFFKACSELNIAYLNNTNQKYSWNSLSGGEKIKLLIAKTMTSKFDFIILDEPTNHLDSEGVSWLINKLSIYKGTAIIVSHDRYFLDATAHKILELENGKAHLYEGNYTFYRNEKKKTYESQLNAYLLQEDYKNKINAEITNLKNWSYKAHRESAKKAIEMGIKKGGKEHLRAKAKKMDNQVKSRIKRLEKISVEGVSRPTEEKKINFSLEKGQKVGKCILSAEDVSKVYDKNTLFNSSTFYINRGEKVGIYGINGCGKTTLLKILLGLESFNGKLNVAKGANIGYISQDVLDMPENQSILDYLNPQNNEELGSIITQLSNLGFESASKYKKLFQLSMGERVKVKLLQMIKNNNDVLILDEPTNHMDVQFREQLEAVLETFAGTLLLVTHDRYMLERICNKLLVFEDKKIKKINSKFSSYISKNGVKAPKTDDLMLINNELTSILSRLCICRKDSDEYNKLDAKYNELILNKKELLAK